LLSLSGCHVPVDPAWVEGATNAFGASRQFNLKGCPGSFEIETLPEERVFLVISDGGVTYELVPVVSDAPAPTADGGPEIASLRRQLAAATAAAAHATTAAAAAADSALTAAHEERDHHRAAAERAGVRIRNVEATMRTCAFCCRQREGAERSTAGGCSLCMVCCRSEPRDDRPFEQWCAEHRTHTWVGRLLKFTPGPSLRVVTSVLCVCR
jgi:hypothetical protein